MKDPKKEVLMEGYVLATGSNIGFKVGYKRFYFVLTDSLSYYETKESFDNGSKCIDVLEMEAFSINRVESRGKYQLIINAFLLFI